MTEPVDLEPDLDLDRVREGLRLAHPPDPAQLAAEKAQLAALERAPPGVRYAYFAKLSGPGFLQSAMTLGSGSAASALFAGAAFGYSLLWVAPVGMLIGILVMGAIAHQTLSTGMRPFEAMRTFAGAPLAWAWAIGALLASMIWHLPQYTLAAACLVDVAEVLGAPGLSPQLLSFGVLAWAVGVSSMYAASPRLVRYYERLLKYMVWGVVVCFAIVVAKTGVRDWGALARGLFAFEIPGERHGVRGFDVVVAGLSAAVGINMVFLYPYSLLARGWGREHRQLARFDLITGMLIPYALATSLMVIATANTLHLDPLFTGSRLQPLEAAASLADAVGPTVGRLVFLLGVLGMALSTITLHMLTCGFVCSELFGWRVGSWKYRLATWLPTPAVFAPMIWAKSALWLAVPTTIVCGLFLPAAYIGFGILHGSRAYLGADLPTGPFGRLVRWLIFALTAGLILVLAKYVYGRFA